MADRVQVTCSCCSTKLTVDTASGEVLAEERPKVDLSKSFEQALDNVRGGTRKREEAFSKAFERTQNLDDLLNKKFEEAKKKAVENPSSKPRGPFDAE